MVGSRVIGIYGSLEKVLKLSLRVNEVYTEPNPEVARRAKELGITYVPVLWVPKTKELSEGVVDIYGNKSLFAFRNSGCISNPKVLARTLGEIEKVATELEARSAILDALRLPSPHDGVTFFSCFCKYCMEKARSLGVNLGEVRNKLKEVIKNFSKYPYLEPEALKAISEWVYVRQEIVKETLGIIAEKAKEYGLKLWAATFPPSLAWLVGQNYVVLVKYLDEAHVMLYHKCNGAACLNHELASLTRLTKSSKATALLTGIAVKDSEALENQGLDPEIIIDEANEARTLLSDKVLPILQHDNVGLETSKKLVDFKKIAFLS